MSTFSQSKGGCTQEVALEGEGVHVPRGQGEEHLLPGVLADGVSDHGGVGAGNAAGIVVHGDEIGVELSGGVEEVEGRATGRGEVTDNKGVTSL